MSKFIRIAVLTVSFGLFAFVSANAQIATGGTYALTKTLVSNGGGESIGGTYGANGSTGQNSIGASSTGGTYSSLAGFWSGSLAPTAAMAFVAGRVVQPNGQGIGNVLVMVSGGSMTSPKMARTNQFGIFSITDVEVGNVYIVTVINRHYVFPQDTQVISVNDNVTDLVFTSN